VKKFSEKGAGGVPEIYPRRARWGTRVGFRGNMKGNPHGGEEGLFWCKKEMMNGEKKIRVNAGDLPVGGDPENRGPVKKRREKKRKKNHWTQY